MDGVLLLALLFVGGFLAAAVSGFAGFGGALLLLPVLVYALGTDLAVPVLTMAQLIGNLSRAGFGFREIKWRPVALFCVGAVPLTVLGAALFVTVPSELITRLVGLAIIAFVILRFFNLIKLKGATATMVSGGGVTGFISGLVGSAGPLGAAVFLSLNLSPTSYVASEAVTAVVMHLTKVMVYQSSLDLGVYALLMGLFMGLAMVLGTWVGRRIIAILPKGKFVNLVGVLLIVVGAQMALFG